MCVWSVCFFTKLNTLLWIIVIKLTQQGQSIDFSSPFLMDARQVKNYVQMTSCHFTHNTSYTYFLLMDTHYHNHNGSGLSGACVCLIVEGEGFFYFCVFPSCNQSPTPIKCGLLIKPRLNTECQCAVCQVSLTDITKQVLSSSCCYDDSNWLLYREASLGQSGMS